MPLTPNGKINRKVLPEPETSELSLQEYVPARNDIEEKLVDIWKHILSINQIGIFDNFFELGGHSLLATRMVSATRKALDIEIAIKDVFVYPTIAELGEHIQGKSKGKLLPSVTPQERTNRIPLSFSQERLWFVDQLKESIAYHIPVIVGLKGDLDISAVEMSLKTILSRHEVLRTVIKSDEGVAYQEILPPDEWKMDRITISDPSELDKVVTDYTSRPFDLSSDYMLRTCLCELGEGKYVLATIFHHISSDGWSDGIFINEFVELYQSQQEKREPSLVNLPIQYVDYALWQRKYIEGQLMDVELSYWENQLTDVSPLVLPTDYSRPQIQSTSGAVLSFELDKELRDVLMNTCKEEGVTLFMLLLTAFKVLLYKYSGQQDICVGTPIANRTQTELENLIGFFVNTLAIRSNLEGNPTFVDLLNVVKSTTLDAYEHQLVPFEKVVDRVVDVRDMSTSPLFQVFFALQNTPEEENSELNGITLSSYTSEHTTSRFDISMTAEDIKSGISLEIEYCTDLFKEETIYRMMVHFEELLKNIVIRPKEHIADVTILTEAEKEQLLVNFNATQTDYNSKRTVVQLFLDQVAKTPEHTAIVFKGEEMTYTELDRHSNQLAHYLLSNYTLGKEDLIGIKLDRSEWLIISILAVLKTGCAYVPIDPNYPQERISYIKEDSNSGTIIDQDLLDQYQGDKENYDDTLPDIDIQANHLAYVIYTSGSTGKPKGVMVEHKSLINLCLWHQQTYEVTDQSRGALFSGVGFDASVWEIYPYILGGGSLYPIYEDETRYDISWLTNFIEVNEISHIYIPSQICHNLVEEQVYLDQVKILTGGDTLKLTKPTSLKIYNNYGPTENTVVTTFCEVSENQSNAIPIGKPVSNTSVYILGTSEELLPIGVTGELCISGSGLARGYLNQKELTQDKFVKNPFQEGLMYKTGDLARWLPDGNIEFIGRKDDQVKIRGYRIELGEIENVLEEIPDIIQSVVLTKEDTHSNKRLVGYVVSNDTIDKEELQNLLLSKLPEYMVPRLWVALETIPLTNNGKIDKKALPDPDMSDIVKDYVAPQNEIEESLSVIWQDVLGIKQVGIHDNFFELGGDSIITIQVVSRAKHEGLVMQPRDLFKYQTISELAEAIQQGSSLVVGEQGILTGESDLLPIQQWYFNNSYSELEDANYNQTLLLSIDKSMKISYLEEMVQTLVEHHDALRSTYHKEGEEWKQTYSKNVSTLIVEDLSLIPTGNLTESITTVCKFYQRSLSIERGEVFKIIVFKTPEEESDNRLFIVAHHLLIDGVSWRILINDINLILNSLQRETKVDLGVKSSSYRQWVNSIKEYAVNKAFFSQQEYWSSIINSYKTLTVDYSDKGLKKWGTVSECHMILDKELTTSLLQDVNQAYGTEINDILLSCLALTISKWSGFENVVVGLEGHGREDIARDIDTSNTVGWFTSLYPISLSLQSNFSLGDVIKSVKEELRSIPNKGLGYGALKYLHPDTAVRDALSGTHWDITFNYLGQFDNIMKEDSIIGLAGEFSGNDVGDQVAFCNKLEVSGSINDGSLVLTWFYSENEYNQDTIKKLSDEYKSNLTALIHHCVSKEARDFTPSDYGLGEEVNYQELDAFLNEDSDSEELLKI
ncbi:non-ribosomal peptide synthetase [Aquimarina sp. Aq78]|nr:non-ribosomal peptide synthetase [Aquimarina sp. Aq78]